MSDFTAVLHRVQGDYAFYVRLQSDPESALAEYGLNADERAALTDPQLLAAALQARPWRITIKISGSHDWVNRSPRRKDSARTQLIEREAQLAWRAENATARRESALRLIQLLE